MLTRLNTFLRLVEYVLVFLFSPVNKTFICAGISSAQKRFSAFYDFQNPSTLCNHCILHKHQVLCRSWYE